MAYQWISNGGCEICDQMSTATHFDRPARPHHHCRCTIVELGTGGKGYCTLPHNSVLQISLTDTSYTPDEGLPERITFEYDIEVLCRDESTMTVSMTIDLQGSELDELQEMSLDDADNLVADKVNERSLELADELCPACPRPIS